MVGFGDVSSQCTFSGHAVHGGAQRGPCRIATASAKPTSPPLADRRPTDFSKNPPGRIVSSVMTAIGTRTGAGSDISDRAVAPQT